ncbi:MAG TPA: hypothetical protein VI727_03780 [Candidatus Brocadiaceae bacterium]|nr:hypothetical protein [Candidatus Brocadiaceae bacterium]
MEHGIINKIYLLGDRYTTLPSFKDPGFLRATFAIATKSAVKFIILMILSLLVIGLWINGRLKRHIIIPITLGNKQGQTQYCSARCLMVNIYR